ncbi:unnamed protein product [Boreogadus saida]
MKQPLLILEQQIIKASTHMFQDGGVPAYGVVSREPDKSGPGLERQIDCQDLFDSCFSRN